MSEEEKKYVGRGGWRGGGRPKGSVKPEGVRKQRQTRAYDDEWELIKEFAKIVKKDKSRAEQILKELQ